jgi:hypothetical protein
MMTFIDMLIGEARYKVRDTGRALCRHRGMHVSEESIGHAGKVTKRARQAGIAFRLSFPVLCG